MAQNNIFVVFITMASQHDLVIEPVSLQCRIVVMVGSIYRVLSHI